MPAECVYKHDYCTVLIAERSDYHDSQKKTAFW